MVKLRLGIIGLSEGNGHPYSWSAIINGYDYSLMKDCGFPVIPEYLSKQDWPKDMIQNARINSIWTQDIELSNKISVTCNIRSVEDNFEAMIGKVDAILLARDDSENHFYFAKKFLSAGLPIYIDKPIATNLSDLNKIYDLETFQGQIFSCSATRYSYELKLSKKLYREIGSIKEINAYSPKSWEKYSVHIIEPVLSILGHDDALISSKLKKNREDKSVLLKLKWKSGVITTFECTGTRESPIKIVINGTNGSKELVFSDTFSAFKVTLQTFIDNAINEEFKPSYELNKKIVSIIELGI